MSTLYFSHPTGNANVRAALNGLLEADLLGEFQTTLATFPGNLWDILGKVRWGREFKRRSYNPKLRPLTTQTPARELGRVLSERLGLHSLNRQESGVFSMDSVYQTQDRVAARRLRAAPKTHQAVYAFEDGALETFIAARELNLRRIYDLPIAYWQTLRGLLLEEAERLPCWKPTLQGGTSDSESKLNRKTRELELAELVICPSQFVARSIPETVKARKPIRVVPFGAPATGELIDRRRPGARPLRVLFAGSMSQRKGLGDLFAAMQLLKRRDLELVVLGLPQAPMEFYRKQYGEFLYEPVRPHGAVLELMRSCDVFCLPSIVEGRALVMQEAMSQGLPLIITPNTGGEDLVANGRAGFLVPIRRPEQIAEKMEWFAEHRSELLEMSRSAQVEASRLTWEQYGQNIARVIRTFLKS